MGSSVSPRQEGGNDITIHGYPKSDDGDLTARIAALEFNVREWRDKAQDKITECDALESRIAELERERDGLREMLRKALAWDHDCHWMKITGSMCERCDGGEEDAIRAALAPTHTATQEEAE